MADVSEHPGVALAYDESRRGLARQEQRLDEVRARAATVLTAASISAAFLAGSNLTTSKIEPLTWFGLGAYVLLTVVVAVMLLPARNWTFVLDGDWMLGRVDDEYTVEQLRRVLIERIEEFYRRNEQKLKLRSRGLAFSCLLLMIELVLFLFDLRGV